MSMWDEAAKAAEKHSGQGGVFLSLTGDGDSARVAFIGEPMPKEVMWTGSGYEDFDPDKHDGKPSLRVKINVFNVAENKMQIFEMNSTTFKILLRAREKYGLDKKLFEITRSGAKGDPKTTYSILVDDAIDEALAERIKHEKPLSLTDKNGETSSPGQSDNNRELLTSLLRSLPKDKLNTFLTKFEVKKVGELPDGKLLDALAVANQLQKSDNNKQAEIDPFA